MFSCNCLNIIIEIEKNDKITKETLGLTNPEDADSFFNQDVWCVGKLCNINKVHPGLIRINKVGLWNITQCLNCEVQTHAINAEKCASYCLIHSKLLNQEAINDVKSSDLFSTIYHIIVNPNAIGPDNSVLDTYNRKVGKAIKDVNDVITNYIRKEQAAVEERIKKYSDEQYEFLNGLKDKAYKEREALVRIIQNAAREDGSENDLSPKSPKVFGNVSSDKHSASNSPSEVPFSPKRPKSLVTEKESQREDLMFDFEIDQFVDVGNSSKNSDMDDSDSEDIEEAEDVVNETSGISILQGRSAGSSSSIAKSCPVDIPIFSQPMRSKKSRPEGVEGADDFSPRQNEQFDIAASIKALAKSVHGDAIFGELPRPKFSTQI